ncbi:hypothetical protein HOD05_05365 [Candidatus Woesearchaeota archaeon]|jgi:hypothetical protein|nr:hypothetical protein [Candidatus Woesearchaeota archaeon]MBT4150520.1 hypothetical protein [Candidatus Woesearchaeota archaeon]MBT4247161.1 hypothetical protein [Candidatus Woesearchaeota archaeon]MBT4434614.1 hypothetical protein [Candidatus Woesearchaeota archaeon]MBT7332535.1 hypothetical protein [Candidatus Woesearchaeota archaeon]
MNNKEQLGELVKVGIRNIKTYKNSSESLTIRDKAERVAEDYAASLSPEERTPERIRQMTSFLENIHGGMEQIYINQNSSSMDFLAGMFTGFGTLIYTLSENPFLISAGSAIAVSVITGLTVNKAIKYFIFDRPTNKAIDHYAERLDNIDAGTIDELVELPWVMIEAEDALPEGHPVKEKLMDAIQVYYPSYGKNILKDKK